MVACSHPGGEDRPVAFTYRLCGPGGTLCSNGWTLWAGFGGMDRAPPARDSNGPESMVERERRARGGTSSGGTASGGKVRLGDNSSQQLGPFRGGLGYESGRVFSFSPDLICANPSQSRAL